MGLPYWSLSNYLKHKVKSALNYVTDFEVAVANEARASVRQRYPDVRWMGVMPTPELADTYAAADLFVFPRRSETFGLVMLEAMASGTPVAAYPVDGPLEVLGTSAGDSQGGIMNVDLKRLVRRRLPCRGTRPARER